MKVLTRDEILAAGGTRIEKVPLPSGQGHVAIRALPTRVFWDLGKWQVERGKDADSAIEAMLKMVALTVVDEDGRPLFDETSPKDMKALWSLDIKLIRYLFKEAERIAGVTEDDVQRAMANLSDGQSGNSSTT